MILYNKRLLHCVAILVSVLVVEEGARCRSSDGQPADHRANDDTGIIGTVAAVVSGVYQRIIRKAHAPRHDVEDVYILMEPRQFFLARPAGKEGDVGQRVHGGKRTGAHVASDGDAVGRILGVVHPVPSRTLLSLGTVVAIRNHGDPWPVLRDLKILRHVVVPRLVRGQGRAHIPSVWEEVAIRILVVRVPRVLIEPDGRSFLPLVGEGADLKKSG